MAIIRGHFSPHAADIGAHFEPNSADLGAHFAPEVTPPSTDPHLNLTPEPTSPSDVPHLQLKPSREGVGCGFLRWQGKLYRVSLHQGRNQLVYRKKQMAKIVKTAEEALEAHDSSETTASKAFTPKNVGRFHVNLDRDELTFSPRKSMPKVLKDASATPMKNSFKELTTLIEDDSRIEWPKMKELVKLSDERVISKESGDKVLENLSREAPEAKPKRKWYDLKGKNADRTNPEYKDRRSLHLSDIKAHAEALQSIRAKEGILVYDPITLLEKEISIENVKVSHRNLEEVPKQLNDGVLLIQTQDRTSRSRKRWKRSGYHALGIAVDFKNRKIFYYDSEGHDRSLFAATSKLVSDLSEKYGFSVIGKRAAKHQKDNVNCGAYQMRFNEMMTLNDGKSMEQLYDGFIADEITEQRIENLRRTHLADVIKKEMPRP